MPTSEYLELRSIAESNNRTMDSRHPCQRGVADCCEENIYVSTDDQDYIMEGFQSGEFSDDLRQHALHKSRGTEKSCPFLDNDRNCTIYARRPLICVATGTFALPHSTKQASQIEGAREAGLEGIPLKDLSSSMCPRCHTIMEKRGMGLTIQSLEDSQRIARNYLNGQRPIREFIEDRLSDSK